MHNPLGSKYEILFAENQIKNHWLIRELELKVYKVTDFEYKRIACEQWNWKTEKRGLNNEKIVQKLLLCFALYTRD